MTTELEQEFYDIFDIEPKYKTCIFRYCRNKKEYDCDNCGDRFWHYPEITAEKLLEMICILNETACEVLASENIEDLKNEILETCIKVYNTPILTSDGDEYDNNAIYDKIQQLFKN